MKKSLFSILMAATLLLGCATQQERAEKREAMRKAVAEAVEKKQIHVGILSMNSMRYGSRTVTPDFFLELRGDTLRSYLPYLGQVHQASITSPSQGLNFETVVQNYQLNSKKAHKWEMELVAKTQEDTYHYRIELYDTGQTYIQVRSLHRDPISFDGRLE